MSGETNLQVLLSSLNPIGDDEVYTFAILDDVNTLGANDSFALIREKEGTTVICPLQRARRAGLIHEGEFARITLAVHSSLQAVGLTAHFSKTLADAGISCNVVAGFYHDHLFVPWACRDEALRRLQNLTESPVQSDVDA